MFWTLLGIAFLTWFVLVLLFTPRIDYHVTIPLRPDSDEFLHVIQSTCQAALHHGNEEQVFTNGSQFYPAMRDAILAAQVSVNLEAYIFTSGEVADMLIDAMFKLRDKVQHRPLGLNEVAAEEAAEQAQLVAPAAHERKGLLR